MRLGGFQLRLEHGNLFLGGDGVGLRSGVGRLGLHEVRGVLLRLFDGDGIRLDEPLIALVFLLREDQRGLRLRGLFFGLIDLGLLGGDLRDEIVGAGLFLIVRRDIVAIVETDELGAGFDQLVVGDGNLDNRGGDLRADLDRAGIDKGVVGRLIVSGMEPPEEQEKQQDDAADGGNGHQTATLVINIAP